MTTRKQLEERDFNEYVRDVNKNARFDDHYLDYDRFRDELEEEDFFEEDEDFYEVEGWEEGYATLFSAYDNERQTLDRSRNPAPQVT